MKNLSKLLGIVFLTAITFAFLSCEQPANSKPKAVVKPTATPAGGNYTSAQTVTLTTATEGAAIRYTLDGTTPTTTSTLYSSAITVGETTTLKAIAVKSGWTNSDILTETYTITLTGKVVQPTATPAGGNYTTAQTVTLTSATTEADIYYTLDETTPNAKYSNPITINTTTTLKAVAVKSGMPSSVILTETYTITPPGKVVQPLAAPTGGNYTSAQTVTLTSATTGANIHYTLDGTTPTTSSTKYLSPITISTTTILKAVAVKSGMTNSDILTETYTITTAEQPSASPPEGNYVLAQTVTLTTITAGADIHYTLDGTDPTASSPPYSNPITISETTTLKAIAIKADMFDSGILTATYNIGYTVTFDADGGNPAPTSPVTVKPGSTIAHPPAMNKTWHTFDKWYTDSECTIPAVFPITVTADITLYAKWIVIVTTLTSVNDARDYLTFLKSNTKDNPISLIMNINLGTMTEASSGWQQLLDVINTAGKYVNLNLSACTMNGTSFNPAASLSTGKDKIVSLVLPTVATSIANGTTSNQTFKNFSNLKSISGAYITTIGDYAFYNSSTFNPTTSLQNVDFPRTTSIGYYAFYYCTSLQSVNFPQVTSIGYSAFFNCTSLQSISFPQAASIDYRAFSNCTSLQRASFPATAEVGRMGSSFTNSFDSCTSLTSFTLSGSGNLSVIENGKALVRNGTILLAYPSASGTITLNTITAIDNGAFLGCTDLQNASLPQVTSIDILAFHNCTSLQSLNIPRVTSIGSNTFSFTGTTALVITMGYSAPTLGYTMFNSLSGSATKTVTVKIPTSATGYTPASSPFNGTSATVSGTSIAANWANGLRGGGWNRSTWDSNGGTEDINHNITVIIERQ